MSQYLSKHASQRGMGQLTVPTAIARATPDDARFEAEMTDEGILFRFVGIVPRDDNGAARLKQLSVVPEWAQQ